MRTRISATIALVTLTALSAGTGLVAHAGTASDTRPPAPTATKPPVKKASATKRPVKRAPVTKPVTTAPGQAFTAYGGARTPWRAVVKNGRLSYEGRGIRARTVRVERSAFSKGVEFTGRQGRQELALVVRSGRCVDVTGENTGMRATLSIGTKTLRGCAVSGAYPTAGG